MNFRIPPQLENERIRLEPLNDEHFALLLPFALNEPELWTYSLVSGAGKEGFFDYINTALTEKTKATQIPFAVYDKQKEAYAGCTRFYDINVAQRTMLLGYTWYGKEFQRSGLNKHCKFLLLQFGFDYLGMQRIEFRADKENTASQEAMRKIGCTYEGTLRSNCFRPDGGRRDSVVYSILKSEWEARENSIRELIENQL